MARLPAGGRAGKERSVGKYICEACAGAPPCKLDTGVTGNDTTPYACVYDDGEPDWRADSEVMKRDALIKWLADNNYPKSTTITCDSCTSAKAEMCKDAYGRHALNGSCRCHK